MPSTTAQAIPELTSSKTVLATIPADPSRVTEFLLTHYPGTRYVHQEGVRECDVRFVLLPAHGDSDDIFEAGNTITRHVRRFTDAQWNAGKYNPANGPRLFEVQGWRRKNSRFLDFVAR